MQPTILSDGKSLIIQYTDPNLFIKLYPNEPQHTWSVWIHRFRERSDILRNHDVPAEFLALAHGCVTDQFIQPLMDWCGERDDVFQYLFTDPVKFITLWSEIHRV